LRRGPSVQAKKLYSLVGGNFLDPAAPPS